MASQRLRQLESHIRKCAEAVNKNGLDIGKDLIAIRDEELWKTDGYASWNQYLKANAEKLIGQGFRSAARLIGIAEVKNRISDNVVTNLQQSHLEQIGRLVPSKGKDGEKGKEKDYSQLKSVDVDRVVKKAEEIGGGKVTTRSLAKAVDEDLGIAEQRRQEREERKQESEERKRMRDEWNELSNVLARTKRDLQYLLRDLQKVSAEGWELLAKNKPTACESLAAVCDELAVLLRS